MSADAWQTLAVTVLMVFGMIYNVAGPDMVLLAAVTALLALGVISPGEAFSGFSNVGMLTVGVLFAVAAGVRETGALDVVSRSLLGHPSKRGQAQLRLMFPVLGMSALLNNTPVVAMLVPLISDWSRRIKIASSYLLMPLSFAAIMGGTCTLIGTSTNLIVFGLAQQHTGGDGRAPIHLPLFEIALVGLPVVLVGALYILTTSRWLLPARSGVLGSLGKAREYTVPIRVEASSSVVNKSVEAAGLRNLPGLFLVHIERNGEPMPAVGPSTRLFAEDLLFFVGQVDSVMDLRKVRGLVPATDQIDKLLEPGPNRCLVEAVLSAQSPMVGINVRDAAFRTRYNAAIIAVHRNGQRVPNKIGDIVLQPGDTLLLEASPSFVRIFRNDNNFALVAEVENSTPPRHDRAWIAGLILAGMVLATLAGVPLITAALLAAGGLVVTRCISGQDARRSVDMRVLLAIAAAFGVGKALEVSGTASMLADNLVDVGRPFGPIGALAAVYAATSLMSAFIGNNASAVLMFPVAMDSANLVTEMLSNAAGVPVAPDLALRAFLYGLMMAASLNFATPISYATNLMVYGPGGYRFTDFVRFGLPLQILLGAVACTVIRWVWLP